MQRKPPPEWAGWVEELKAPPPVRATAPEPPVMSRALKAKFVSVPAATAADAPPPPMSTAPANGADAHANTRVRSEIVVCIEWLLDLGDRSLSVRTRASTWFAIPSSFWSSTPADEKREPNRRRRRTDNEHRVRCRPSREAPCPLSHCMTAFSPRELPAAHKRTRRTRLLRRPS